MMNEESNRPNNFYFANDCCSDDIFVCGKCQCQFKNIKIFMDHKTNFCITNYPDIKQSSHNQIKLPIIAHGEHNFQPASYYTDDLNNSYIGGYETSTGINYLYNDGNTPKNNINGSYVSFIDEGKYQHMEFPNEIGPECLNKNDYFNELNLPHQKETIFNDSSNNDINYQIYPLTNEVFNVGNEGYINHCSGNVMKATINNVDFGYPSIMTRDGSYLENITCENGSSNPCLYGYDSEKLMLANAKNDIEIVNISTNNYGNGFNDVDNNPTQAIFTMPSFKAELLGDTVAIVNANNNINLPHLSDKETYTGQSYSVNNKVSSANFSEAVVVEHQTPMNKVTKRYDCDYCLKFFCRYSNLEQHLRLHTGEKPFQCPICGRKFSQKSNAKKHIKSHKVWRNCDNSSLPKFHTIGVQLKDKRHLIVRPSKSLSPIISRKQFHLLTNIKNRSMFGVANDNHDPVILVNNNFECSFCKQKFQSYQKLRSHIVSHKDSQVYLCVFADCKQTFDGLEQFLVHLEAHKKDENIKFNCQFCSISFTTLYELMCHYKEHSQNSGNVGSKCQKCHKQVQNDRVNGVKTNVGASSSEYFCSHCNKTFKSQKNFKSHITNFELRQHFSCPICSKGFSAEIYLSRHLRVVHKSSMILFKCKQCDKIFRTMSSLKYHRSSQHKVLPHPDCKMDHSHHKKMCTTKEVCQCSSSANKKSPKKKVLSNNISSVSISDSQSDPHLKLNFDEDGMVCFYCGKLYRRRLPFESHVLMCKQKEIEKERRVSYRNQQTEQSIIKSTVDCSVVDLDRSTRRLKFTKTWTAKSSRKAGKSKSSPTTDETFATEIRQTLPSISVLNKSYDIPLDNLGSLKTYGTESISFLKSLEFNS